MVTEEQRKHLLLLSSTALTDIPTVIQKAKEQLGIKLTERQIIDAVNQLKTVRGS